MILIWKIKFCWFWLTLGLIRRRSRKLLQRYPFLSWSKKYYGYTNYDELPATWRHNFGAEMLDWFDRVYAQMSPQERLLFQVDFEVSPKEGLLITYGRYCTFRDITLIDLQKYYNHLSRHLSTERNYEWLP